MRRYQGLLPWSVLLASIGGSQAKLNLNSSSNVVVYWGQNSFNGKADQAQQPLAHYCDNDDIDVIPMAFNMMVNGPGGVPEVDFAVSSKDCDVFEGTQLKNCPKIGKDIQACQKKHKTILLSIGGATYSEGGFKSEQDAKDGAKLMWETFGPKQEGSNALRPFGDAAIDGFDFDFEANVQNMAPFANELRALIEADTSKQEFFLTAAPQCVYPDQADKEILNGPVYIDAIWVQFYNNFCGVNNFNTDSASNKYNFDEWDNWAKTVSKNKDVKVLVGVPAFKTAASTGYIPASELDKVIQYSKKFESFGGVMMWDATQAYGNDGFIEDVRQSLGPADDDSGSSSPDPSTSAPTSTSTDTTKTKTKTKTTTEPPTTTKTETPTSTKPKTSPSSSAPDSSLSSSSFSSATPSHKEPEITSTVVENNPATITTENKPTTIATHAKPTTASTKTTPPEPSTIEAEPTSIPTTADPESNASTVSQTPASPTNTSSPQDSDNSDDDKPKDADEDKNDEDKDDDEDDDDYLTSIVGNDIVGLLNGLRQANKAVGGVTHGLTKNLRHGQRNRV